MLLRTLLALILVFMSWFYSSPAWAVTSTQQLYLNESGYRTKIGAARCEAFTGGNSSAIGIVALFRTINRPAPNQPRVDTGLSFDTTFPATMLISHQGLVSSVFSVVKSPQEQRIATVIPARGVPPFTVTIGGLIATKQHGEEHYTDANGKLDIELT